MAPGPGWSVTSKFPPARGPESGQMVLWDLWLVEKGTLCLTVTSCGGGLPSSRAPRLQTSHVGSR